MIKDASSWRWASLVSTTSEASSSADEEDDAPVHEPEYGDLLDEQWLQRGSDALDPEDDLVDIALTIEMADSDDLDEANAMELDVGALLTPLPAQELPDGDETAEREGADRALGALQELLLPEEQGAARREEDEEIGDDERFPAFDDLSAPGHSGLPDDDAEGPHGGK